MRVQTLTSIWRISLVLFIGLGPWRLPAPAQDSAVSTLLKQAASLESRGRYDLAVQTWQRALLANPDQSDALLGLARQAKRTGNSVETERLLGRLRAVAPGRPELLEIESMRVTAGREDRLAEAQRLAAAQDYTQAMAIYREVVGPTAPPGGLAAAYYETEAATPGGWPNAVNGLRRLAARFPDAPAYKLSLGRLLTYRPETRLEGAELLRAVAADSESARPARSAWRQALVWEGPSARAIPALEAYLAGGSDPEMQQLLEQSRSARPAAVDSSGAVVARGYEALDADRLEDAERSFQEALRASPRNAAASAGLGFLRMKQQRFGDAVQYLERALELSPDDQVVRESLNESRFWSTLDSGRRALEENRVDEATTRYREALELRPDNLDAVRSLAGVLMRQGRAAEAAPLFERVVAADPADHASWKALIRTIHDSDGVAAALERSGRISESIALALEQDVEHLILMASIYGQTGRQAQFDRAFQKVLRNTPNEADAMSPIRLQFAGLLNQMGRSLEAAAEYERTVEVDPGNLDAWEGLVAALMNESNGRAMAVLSRMPGDVYEEALKRPTFLFNVGLLHRQAGRHAEASTFLRGALGMGDKLSRRQQIDTRLQLAYLSGERGGWAEAERSLRRMIAEYPNEPEVWKALLSTLQEQGRSSEAKLESERIPATVITRLYTDSDYVALMASVHNSLGLYSAGLRLVRDAIAIQQAERQPVPVELEVQLGWLLLNSGQEPHEQYRLLQAASAREDLTDEQRAGIDELWTVWSLREAATVSQAGDYERATSILAAALKIYPEDNRLYASLAGVFLDAGDPAQALFVYRNWGLNDGSEDDYAGAIGAAMTLKDDRVTQRWLREALLAWPESSKLLRLAGTEAASRGDYRRAERYWQMALEAMPAESSKARDDESMGGVGGDPQTRDLGRLLVAGVVDPASDERYNSPAGPSAQAAGSSRMRQDALSEALDPDRGGPTRGGPQRTEPQRVGGRDSSARIAREPSAPVRIFDEGLRASAAPAPRAATPLDPVSRSYGPAQRPAQTPQQELEDRIAGLHARNSPFVGVNPLMRGRSGREGFETLSEQQLNFETSTVIRDKLRFALYARPTFLDAGNPDGNSELRLGLAPTGSRIGPGTASGVGAEAQLSSDSFGLKLGSTPDGFLVRNFTLGLRLRPSNGPFSLVLDRDVIKDTMLSYAGVRDPVTGQIFGGAMANSLALQGDWAGAESGVFVRAGYQYITGEQVQTNRRIDGGGGAWWRVLETQDGSLTFGANLFAMKYDKNLRFFTLGHGGYFSPQRYVLFNVPLTWRGVYDGRIDYSVMGSLGVQHIAEDDAPYFPLDGALQGRRGPFYEGLTQTGEHFSIEIDAGYRVAPHWNLGGFVSINNTRNFTDQRGGIFLRYMFRPQPEYRDMSIAPLPDWTGGRRLGLP